MNHKDFIRNMNRRRRWEGTNVVVFIVNDYEIILKALRLHYNGHDSLVCLRYFKRKRYLYLMTNVNRPGNVLGPLKEQH